jgi:hypothetical protein
MSIAATSLDVYNYFNEQDVLLAFSVHVFNARVMIHYCGRNRNTF